MKKYLDPKFLPYFGALVQGVLFSIAGNKFFEVGGWLLGLGVGIVVNYSIALASSRISDVAKNRKVLSYIALILLACLSPVIICSTLGWSVATFAWSMASDLAIVLAGSIAGKSLLGGEQPTKNRLAKASGRRKPLSKKAAVSAGDYACPYSANGCSATKATQNAINAHAGKCKFKLVVKDTVFEGAKK